MLNINFPLNFGADSATPPADISRDQVAHESKWNLEDLYASPEAWQVARLELEARLPELEGYRGTLGASAAQLYNCLELYSNLCKEFGRLIAYAHQASDQDTRDSVTMGRQQEIEQVGVKLSTTSSFVEPEILALDEMTLQEFFNTDPRLTVYTHYIDNIVRLKPHMRSSSEEEIISQTNLLSGTASDIYGIFKDADMPRASVTLPDGTSVTLDDAAFTLYRAHSDRTVRQQVFEKHFGGYHDYVRTFGVQLYSQVKRDVFYKNVRHYDSSLESALNAYNIPTAVYKSLLASVHENLPTLHRYLQLRTRMLQVDELHYYDMYTPLVPSVDTTYSVGEAQKLVAASLAPLGADYVAVVKRAFAERWIDLYPNAGKASGAYSSGAAYDVHPYILLNYMGKYNDVTTLAHELGHTMHSYLSNKNQPFINADYPIFLAEVASITNEELLFHHVLEGTTDPEKRLSILGNQLEGYRATLFRQTQFAEFELKIHELVESGQTLTGETLSHLYLNILRDYFGHEQGIMKIDDLYGVEWAFIPHFYYNFYVFQYATSFCAARAIAEKILLGGEGEATKYIRELLSAGGSDYAIPTLKRVGVDMLSHEPYQKTFDQMNTLMDEMEKILAELK